ncbi:hypothetical protein F5883DRAFT_709645 [Diaporthe sp. PMI_573]|nr:hypothetical protein F5883DRAFT_709645 [Diaporthaceae sp. PMI_573]
MSAGRVPQLLDPATGQPRADSIASCYPYSGRGNASDPTSKPLAAFTAARPEENYDHVMEEVAKEEAEKRKEDEKRRKILLGAWRKFLMGVRNTERVRLEK